MGLKLWFLLCVIHQTNEPSKLMLGQRPFTLMHKVPLSALF